MSDNPHQQPRRDGQEPQDEGRLEPRPLYKPDVDPAWSAAFARPEGVSGSFDTSSAWRAAPESRDARSGVQAPPVPLAEAFSRPAEDAAGGAATEAPGTSLQRPPEEASPRDPVSNEPEPALWSHPSDPWRDPGAAAVLGGPARAADAGTSAETPGGGSAGMLSLSEVLFGRQVKPRALALLGVIALLLGSAGGAIGWWIGSTGSELTGEVTIAEAEAGKERPAGSVSEIVQRVAPAVVSIEVAAGPQGGVGSGVVVDGDGYVMTNHHVVASAVEDSDQEVTVVFTDGTRAEADIVGSDPKTDLAVLKVNVSNPTVIEVGSSAELTPGDSVIAVGSPFGLENTVTQGIVSAVDRPITAPGQGGDPAVTYDAIQTDAAINPGNSGGALVDSTGALVGINSLIRTGDAQGGGGSIGLGFAIPIDDAVEISESLIEDGSVTHAWLGVRAGSVSSGSSQGAQVQEVEEDGPAADAGISEGDVITGVGERTVRDAAELVVAVREHQPDDVVPMDVVRDGRQLTVDVTLGSD
ncbi:serine protease, S1-C subfamily, contains C-terminal PDZ domain [Haloechinothrix alba]|uniref:Serine protease, S1-C subfamily, contains C-terminal PDZ domain n=1 Tax=Haloechinothrix alba TaxID=664784 RepID=A0A238VXP9_9PSEU|nr:trypsin-like peptidase domain-containing protein [Haloechinothrix alba]SNR39066.1 serine protease, S1-C subfamily, contains C-terminal PDZ domain [Haloechinothrix alba]